MDELVAMPRIPFGVTKSNTLHHCLAVSTLSLSHSLILRVHAVIVSNTILPMGIQASGLQSERELPTARSRTKNGETWPTRMLLFFEMSLLIGMRENVRDSFACSFALSLYLC